MMTTFVFKSSDGSTRVSGKLLIESGTIVELRTETDTQVNGSGSTYNGQGFSRVTTAVNRSTDIYLKRIDGIEIIQIFNDHISGRIGHIAHRVSWQSGDSNEWASIAFYNSDLRRTTILGNRSGAAARLAYNLLVEVGYFEKLSVLIHNGVIEGPEIDAINTSAKNNLAEWSEGASERVDTAIAKSAETQSKFFKAFGFIVIALVVFAGFNAAPSLPTISEISSYVSDGFKSESTKKQEADQKMAQREKEDANFAATKNKTMKVFADTKSTAITQAKKIGIEGRWAGEVYCLQNGEKQKIPSSSATINEDGSGEYSFVVNGHKFHYTIQVSETNIKDEYVFNGKKWLSDESDEKRDKITPPPTTWRLVNGVLFFEVPSVDCPGGMNRL